MLQPPLNSKEIQQALDELIADMRRALRDSYQASGRDKPVPEYKFIAYPSAAEKAQAAKEVAKRVIPPGVNFTDKPRVSGSLRDRYLEHLREACALEYIDVAEMEARMTAMMLANTEDELQFLIHDLPALAGEKEKEGQEISQRKQRANRGGLLAAGLIATVYSQLPVHSISGMIVHVIFVALALFSWSAILSSSRDTRKKNKKKE